MMLEMPITRGYVATIDDEDYELVSKYLWFANPSYKTVYAIANLPADENGKRGHISMHRLIMGFPPQKVDHWDGNGLHNTRKNLRVASDLQNAWNRAKKDIDAASQYKGVGAERSGWSAGICVNGEEFVVYGFASEVDAAIAYDAMARYYYGEFARTNFHGGESKPWEEIKQERLLVRKRGATSKFYGVHFSSRHKRWVVQINIEGKQKEIGSAKTEIEAAQIYNKHAIPLGKKIINDIEAGIPIVRSV